MAALTTQSVPEAGSSESGITFDAAAAGGDTFTNSRREILWLKNAGGAARTVTIDSPNLCNQDFTHDVVVTVPAGDSVIVPVMATNRFGTTVSMTYDSEVSLTIAVLQIIS